MMKWLIILFCAALMTACSFAPTYHRPQLSIPDTYKEGKVNWVRAGSTRIVCNNPRWWEMYHDPVLNQLEEEVSIANQDLRVAFSRYQEARAQLNVARADFFPQVLGVANSYRQQVSKDAANTTPKHIFSDNLLVVNLTYEVDVWGRVRNTVAAARSAAQASAADVAAVALSLHAQLANTYFALRGDDASQQVLNQTVIAYEKAYQLIRRRFRGGASNALDFDQAKTQWETAKTAAADMHLRRMQLEHAIAILIGRVPAEFSIAPKFYRPTLVTITPDLPSTLLERRPDIVRAELLVREANYNIGVARAAFFPAVNLSAGLGVESSMLSNLFSKPSLVWSLGPTTATALLNNGSMPLITQTLFDGGRLLALSDEACAKYKEVAAAYKQTVLQAYQEVEDNLIALRQLDKEHVSQNSATSAARKAMDQSMYRYKEGLTTYLDVVVEQNIFLQAELSNIDVKTRRQMASVQLIKALGGAWG